MMGSTTQAGRRRANVPALARGVSSCDVNPIPGRPVMASASITVRTTKRGRRFVVRYRLGGRAYPIEHGGSFPTMREAKIRRDLVAGELAAGGTLADPLGRARAPPRPPTRSAMGGRVPSDADRHRRRDREEPPLASESDHARVRRPRPGHDHPAGRPAVDRRTDAQARRRCAATSRRSGRILDYAGVDPNPARDPRVTPPREAQTTIEPPSAADVEAMITASPARWRLRA